MSVEKDTITFSFGENWRDFVETISEDSVARARLDIEKYLGAGVVAGKTVLDVGCGSGIHSLCFHMLGAKEIISVDVDPKSVESTKLLWEKSHRPANWRVLQGSVLDDEFVRGLGKHQIVYSWGVLHHTGEMWKAISNAAGLVERGGTLWIAIYAKGPKYAEHLALKQSYNRATTFGKKVIAWKEIYKLMRLRVSWRQNPFAWNEKQERGMDTYHDLLDWLGGLPYEVASDQEIISFCRERGFVEENIEVRAEGACSVYCFRLSE
ncbi:MAG: hypothetical protein QOF62_2845 [Pyrinomonadaceae bacterium]|jgi:2-polyprenyl-6-hydroxyphenyl methylase/3-demethylubiquinone-9 3-methyltransferase|nr:hypothetical protein [Pyrinomonadaceae bacterium]